MTCVSLLLAFLMEKSEGSPQVSATNRFTVSLCCMQVPLLLLVARSTPYVTQPPALFIYVVALAHFLSCDICHLSVY